MVRLSVSESDGSDIGVRVGVRVRIRKHAALQRSVWKHLFGQALE